MPFPPPLVPSSFDVGTVPGSHVHMDSTGLYVYDASNKLVFKQGTDDQGTTVGPALPAAPNIAIDPDFSIGGGLTVPAVLLNLPDAGVTFPAGIFATGAAQGRAPQLAILGPTLTTAPEIDLVSDDGTGHSEISIYAGGAVIDMVNNGGSPQVIITAPGSLVVGGGGGFASTGLLNIGGGSIIAGGSTQITDAAGDNLTVNAGQIDATSAAGAHLRVAPNNVQAASSSAGLRGVVTAKDGTMRAINADNTTATTSAAGILTISHGLGVTPQSVVACVSAGARYCVTQNFTTTTFDVVVRNDDGTVAASVSVSCRWFAFG